MDEALTIHRLQFAFTITYHYLFPQLTMGLALLLVVMKTLARVKREPHFDRAAQFWAKVFAINFVMGVVTGIPMEFQFGTNWAEFSKQAGGVIGQTLAMEGVFAFFLESAFLGMFLFGEKRLSPLAHWFSAFMVFLGSWLSGYFIIVTNAWMQHPVGYSVQADGTIVLDSFWALLFNPWAGWQYAHTMIGSVITACFVVAGVGAYYLLMKRHLAHARTFIKLGVGVGVVAAVLQAFPTGDAQGRMVAQHQPVTLAAMEGLFNTEKGAGLAILGQPDVDNRRLNNPLVVPRMLSFLTHRRWQAEIKGLDAFPESEWPDNIPLLYYAYHIMVGLGTAFIAIMALAAWKLWRGTLFNARWMLWILMLSMPFPYIANTAGWTTAEVGRQPWLIHGLSLTADGASPMVTAGDGLFTLLGFMGLYTLLSILFLFLIYREIEHGPDPVDPGGESPTG
jgi:cytochrome d ubiquinol oxidase subunit I